MLYSGTLTSAKPEKTVAGALVWSGTLNFQISTSAGRAFAHEIVSHFSTQH
jgi:hypothetical protein